MLKVAVSREADIVYAQPVNNVHHQDRYRDVASRVTKYIVGALAGDMSTTRFNSFRVIRGQIARSASSRCSHETYLDIALSWFSSRVETFPLEMFDRRSVRRKESGYTFKKLLSHARRLILSSRIKYLRIGGYIGLVAMFLGILFAGYVLFSELLYPGSFGAVGWASLFVSVAMFNGLIAILITAVLEYLSILVMRAQGKPVFFAVDRSADQAIAAYLTGSYD